MMWWYKGNYISGNFKGTCYFCAFEFLPNNLSLGILYTNKPELMIIDEDCFEMATNIIPRNIQEAVKEYMEDPLFEIELKRVKR